MTDYKYFEAPPYVIRARALWPAVIGVLLVVAAFLIPSAQGLSLVQSIPNGIEWAIRLSDSAKTFGISVITLAAVLVLASRRRLSVEYRLKEAIAVIGGVIVFAGGGAMLNEHVIKPEFNSPRPNVEWLSAQSFSEDVGFTTESYYARSSLVDRSRFMRKVLGAAGDEVPWDVGVHWVTEPGYSFPSGHAYASFFVATFFLLFATTFVATKRQIVFYLLVPWAVLVSLSRVLLHVHRPVDIAVGALQGLVIGLLAWWIIRWIIRQLVQREIGI